MFKLSDRARDYRDRVRGFIDREILPVESTYDHQARECGFEKAPPILDELKAKARAEGLWNLFLPDSERGAGLSNLEYAPICEAMGINFWCCEVFNCNPPDTGNMEILERFATEGQKEQWLVPLLDGKIRSCFGMTEPDVASSDATNIRTRIERDGDHYVINGRKWWSSGASDPRCRLMILMGKTDPQGPRHGQQSMVLVPMDTPGVTWKRTLTVFGYDHAPHGHAEIELENVRVPVENLLHGEGRGFEIAQSRLGPGRIHHCMRAIGVSERALSLICARASERVAFGRSLAEFGTVRADIANSRMEIDQARLMVLRTAQLMDEVGNRGARKEIAATKVIAARLACRVIDRAIQVHGGAGVSSDFPLADAYANYRTLRLADGPDEVHIETVAKLELREQL
ncbi:MAG: acyl-CoA dehydrogenase family protein [Acidobacteriota bacterium]|nr:acyl-CoA dehydrogenase family protein [Acidobacteriota bacterium]